MRYSPFFIILGFLFLCSCSQNPVTGESELHFVSESQEIAIGEGNYSYMIQAEGGPYVTDPEVQEYVEKVGKKLASVSDRPNLPYQFTVLNNSIPNAWALPGGKISINRGLLVELENEAELAAVLAHEIVHSAARHGAKMLERGLLMETGLLGLSQVLQDHKYEDVVVGSAAVGATLLVFKYSRSAELEADKYGIKYMVAAGYDPQAAVALQQTFVRLSENRNPNWLEGLFATHPPSQERVTANEATSTQYPQGGYIGAKEYKKAIATLIKDKPAYKDLDDGYLALKAGQVKKAYDLANQGIAIEPKEGHLFNLKGKVLYRMQEFHESLEAFTKAIELNPYYFDFYLQRGLLEYKMGNYFAAEKDLQKSNELLPSADSYYTLGEINLKQKNYALARKNFEIAAQANSSSGQAARRQLGTASPSYHINKSISVSPSCSLGSLTVSITNQGSHPIKNCEIEVRFYNKKHQMIDKARFVVTDKIAPYTTFTKRTNIQCPHKTKATQITLLKAEAAY